MKIGVYIVNFNNHDNINSVLYKKDMKCYYFIDSNVQVGGYETVKIKPQVFNKSISKASRYLKCNSHKAIEGVHYSIYLDASFMFISNNIYSYIKSLGEFDIAQFHHPSYNCLYKEANNLLAIDKFQSQHKLIKKQIEKYKKEEFPENFGLFSGGFIIRKHCKKIINFNKSWWQEINNGTYRDQVSEMYCIWKNNINFKYIKGNIYENEIIKYNNNKNIIS